MKRASKWGIVGLTALASLTVASVSYGQTYGSGALTTSDPTYHPANASTTGTAVQYYDLYQIAVSVSGAFTLELSSLNTTGTPSNALDTLFNIYTGTFNAAAPGTASFSNDDFTGTLTVLPGPFAGGGYTTASTGLGGAQPGSRSAALNLIAGTTYFLAVTSFRSTDFVPVATTTNAGPTGAYVFGINGPGTATVTAVPEPTTASLLALATAGLGFAVLRRRKTA